MRLGLDFWMGLGRDLGSYLTMWNVLLICCCQEVMKIIPSLTILTAYFRSTACVSTFMKSRDLHGGVHMHQLCESSTVRVMACRLFGTKPLPEPMLIYHQLGRLEQTATKFESKYKILISNKMHSNMSCAKYFCSGLCVWIELWCF